MFHGLAMLGYEARNCGYEDLLNTYRSVFQRLIRPAMHRRFTLVDENRTAQSRFSSRAYAWDDVADDLWFATPELGPRELAALTVLPSLEIIGDRSERHRLFRAAASDRAKVRSPFVDSGEDADTRVNNLLSLATESCGLLATATGHWLVVRPDLTDLYVEMGRISGRGDRPPEVYGWINQGVRPPAVPSGDRYQRQGLPRSLDLHRAMEVQSIDSAPRDLGDSSQSIGSTAPESRRNSCNSPRCVRTKPYAVHPPSSPAVLSAPEHDVTAPSSTPPARRTMKSSTKALIVKKLKESKLNLDIGRQ